MKHHKYQHQYKFPVRYVPPNITHKEQRNQVRMLLKSKREYKKHQYYTRKKLPSYKNKPSHHITNARKLYNVSSIRPSKELSRKTGCKIDALRQIVKRGEGAYFSSGSRPNQTAQSWGLARLASSISKGKSGAVDFDILQKGCNHHKKAYKMALQSRKKYQYGRRKTKKMKIQL
jgi:hypothetical protein